MPNVHVHIHGSSTRDAVKHDPKTRQFVGDAFEEGKHPRGTGGKFTAEKSKAPNHHLASTEPSMKTQHEALSRHGFGMSSKVSGGKQQGAASQGYRRTTITKNGPISHEVHLQSNGDWKHRAANQNESQWEEEHEKPNWKPVGFGKGHSTLREHLKKHFGTPGKLEHE